MGYNLYVVSAQESVPKRRSSRIYAGIEISQPMDPLVPVALTIALIAVAKGRALLVEISVLLGYWDRSYRREDLHFDTAPLRDARADVDLWIYGTLLACGFGIARLSWNRRKQWGMVPLSVGFAFSAVLWWQVRWFDLTAPNQIISAPVSPFLGSFVFLSLVGMACVWLLFDLVSRWVPLCNRVIVTFGSIFIGLLIPLSVLHGTFDAWLVAYGPQSNTGSYGRMYFYGYRWSGGKMLRSVSAESIFLHPGVDRRTQVSLYTLRESGELACWGSDVPWDPLRRRRGRWHNQKFRADPAGHSLGRVAYAWETQNPRNPRAFEFVLEEQLTVYCEAPGGTSASFLRDVIRDAQQFQPKLEKLSLLVSRVYTARELDVYLLGLPGMDFGGDTSFLTLELVRDTGMPALRIARDGERRSWTVKRHAHATPELALDALGERTRTGVRLQFTGEVRLQDIVDTVDALRLAGVQRIALD